MQIVQFVKSTDELTSRSFSTAKNSIGIGLEDEEDINCKELIEDMQIS